MNAIIVSGVWGVVMMFSGIFFKNNSSVRLIAIAGLILLLAMNVGELYGIKLLSFNTHGMLAFNSFTLLFNAIAFACTLIYFFLSGPDFDNVGMNVSDYFALI